MSTAELFVDPDGHVRCLYTEAIDLSVMGEVSLRRASHVEPDTGGWTADLSPVHGPILGPFARRSAALDAESRWLIAHVLGQPARKARAADRSVMLGVERGNAPERGLCQD